MLRLVLFTAALVFLEVPATVSNADSDTEVPATVSNADSDKQRKQLQCE